jgi:hypothetical protein
VEYLELVLSRDGVKPNPERVKAVHNYQRPWNAKEVRTFKGLTSFYRPVLSNRRYAYYR